MRRFSSYIYFALVFLLALMLTRLFFGEVFIHPNGYLFGVSGDGIKNYFNPCYYMRHDSGVMTTAFTYPYGELALFTDAHFSYVYLLNLIDDHLFEINNYTVAFINLAIMWSNVFCALFLFLILRHFKLPGIYSVIFALIITFLSPQLERIIAHYSLTWTFFVPMIWYFQIRLMDGKRPFIWSALLVLSLTFFGFLHPYYLPAGVFFIGLSGALYTLVNIRSLSTKYKTVISMFIAAILPFLFFSAFVAINDQVTDRHLSPYGMFVYNTKFEGAFMPHFGPLYTFLDQLFVIKTTKTAEGHSYIGIIGVLVLGCTAIRLLWNLTKRKRGTVKRTFVNRQLGIAVVAAGLMFYLATGNLFLHFDFLLDWIPRLRQFRSLGRFAWILYYVFAVYCAFYLYLLFRTLSIRGFKPVAWILVVALGSLWAFESYIHARHYISRPNKSLNKIFWNDANLFTKSLEQSGYKPDDFQAIIGFPYMNNGTEKFYVYRKGQAHMEMMKCSYETGLPIATFHSPRTSISQGSKLVQLLSSDYIKKEVLEEMNTKPILLLEGNGSVWNDGRKLLNKAEKIFSNDWYILYKADLKTFDTNHREQTDKFNSIKKDLIQQKDFWTSKPTKAVTLIRYPVRDSSLIFRGHGIYQSGLEQSTVVFEDKIQFDSIPEFLEISSWMYLDRNHASIPALVYEELDTFNNVIVKKDIYPKLHTEVFDKFLNLKVLLTL